MFKIFILLTSTCVVFGLPVDQSLKLDHVAERSPVTVVPIVSEDFFNKGDGSFHFGFVSGTKVEEEGVLKVYDEKTAEEIVHGGYEYVAPDGRSIKLKYIADGSGFHAFSDDVVQSAGVAPLTEYERYFNDKHEIQGLHNPLIAGRSLEEDTQKTVVPVVDRITPFQSTSSNSFPVEGIRLINCNLKTLFFIETLSHLKKLP